MLKTLVELEQNRPRPIGVDRVELANWIMYRLSLMRTFCGRVSRKGCLCHSL
jgi:hypothetical protein